MFYCASRLVVVILLQLLTIIMAAPAAGVSAFEIGTPGVAWGPAEKIVWRDSRKIQRSYQDEVVQKILALKEGDKYEVGTYGSLSQNPDKYPLYFCKSKEWSPKKPSVLITGGVHGYETSGVQGALLFLQSTQLASKFNLLVCPCVSPWGYETIQRWNAAAVDPNRSFNPNGEIIKGRSFNPEAVTEESKALLQFLEDNFSSDTTNTKWTVHIDLHETTDTDDTEFRPAKAARDGVTAPAEDVIPDGFYLVAQPGACKTQSQFFHQLIHAVKQVTHIAPPDPDGTLIGEPLAQEGVIEIPATFAQLGLCAGMTNAEYATLTEVYPDSPSATDEICNQAQVACIEAALKYILDQNKQ